MENTNMETLQEEELVKNEHDILTMILLDLSNRYYSGELDEGEKNKVFEQMMKISDRIIKFDEQEKVIEKAQMENETKKEMNRNDNETKLKIAHDELVIERARVIAEFSTRMVMGLTSEAVGLGKMSYVTKKAIRAGEWAEYGPIAPGKDPAYKELSDYARFMSK